MTSEIEVRALEPGEVVEMLSQGASILELREATDFATSHIRGSLNIQFSAKSLDARVDLIIPRETPLILVGTDAAQIESAVTALGETRGKHLLGYLTSDIEAWQAAGLPIATLKLMTVAELKQRLDEAHSDLVVLDVREPFEWRNLGSIQGALLIPLGEVGTRLSEVPQEKTAAVICEHGIRSSTATSLLVRDGYARSINVIEGMSEWRKAGYPVVESL